MFIWRAREFVNIYEYIQPHSNNDADYILVPNVYTKHSHVRRRDNSTYTPYTQYIYIYVRRALGPPKPFHQMSFLQSLSLTTCCFLQRFALFEIIIILSQHTTRETDTGLVMVCWSACRDQHRFASVGCNTLHTAFRI